jgi:hypothetical protein
LLNGTIAQTVVPEIKIMQLNIFKKFLSIFLVIGATAAWSTTYYIDYVDGSDSSDGLAKVTGGGHGPWKHAPGMKSCSGNCLNKESAKPQPGDSIILKGGVTWPNDAFPWQWYGLADGTAAKPIYIGVDKSWYGGNAWTRPIMDAQGDTLAPKYPGDPNVMFRFCNNDYVILDNFELKGMNRKWNGDFCFVFIGGNYDTVRNFYIHGWYNPPTALTTGTVANGSAVITVASTANMHVGDPIQMIKADGSFAMPIISNGPIISAVNGNQVTVNAQAITGDCASTPCRVQAGEDGGLAFGSLGYSSTGTVIENCIVDGWEQPEVRADPNCTGNCLASLRGVYAAVSVRNSIFRYLSNGFVGTAREFSGNLIEYIRPSINPTMHTNGFENNDDDSAGTLFFNNVIRHLRTGVPVWLAPRADAAAPTYVWNNVLYDLIPNASLEMAAPLGAAPGSVVVWNNTIVGGQDQDPKFPCTQCPGSYVSCKIQNNHFITSSSTPIQTCGSNCTQDHNVTQTMAAASGQGYADTQEFAFSPASGSNASIGAGVNLTSTAAGELAPLLYDAAYAVSYDTVNHTVIFPARTRNARPAGGAWDVGAYHYKMTKIRFSNFNRQNGAAARPLPPNPIKAVLFKQYLQKHNDVSVYDVEGNSIGKVSAGINGVYLVRENMNTITQKVIVIK